MRENPPYRVFRGRDDLHMDSDDELRAAARERRAIRERKHKANFSVKFWDKVNMLYLLNAHKMQMNLIAKIVDQKYITVRSICTEYQRDGRINKVFPK